MPRSNINTAPGRRSGRSLADGFVAHADKCPTQAAFVLDQTVLSYRELLAQSDRWLVYLRHLFSSEATSSDAFSLHSDRSVQTGSADVASPGAESATAEFPSQLVAWEGSNHSNLPALYLACVRAGFCLVLLDPAWPAERTEKICQTLDLSIRITPDTNPDAGMGKSQSGHQGQEQTGLLSDIFLLGFTSGSTGFPKAFIRTQQSWLASFNYSSQEFSGVVAGKVLAPGPLSHGLSFFAMAETLNAGGTFFCLSRFDARRAIEVIQNRAVDVLVAVPTILQAMSEPGSANVNSSVNPSGENPVPGSPTKILSAGAKISPAARSILSNCWPRARISEYYGASELSFVSVAHAEENAPHESVGRGFSGVELSIRDVHGQRQETGERGLVWVESDMLATASIEFGDAGAELNIRPVACLHSDGCYRGSVGDIGMLDEQGFLYLLDRANDMIITGGLNVSPATVETVLQKHPDIAACAVLGVADDYWGEQVCAVLQLSAGATLSHPVFNDFCLRELSAEQIPRQVFTAAVFPLTSSGKLARAELRHQLQSQPALFGRLNA